MGFTEYILKPTVLAQKSRISQCRIMPVSADIGTKSDLYLVEMIEDTPRALEH